jgi:hypothetical protein
MTTEPIHTPAPWAIDLESRFTLGGDTRSVEALTPDGKMVTREVCTLMFDSDGWPDAVEWQEDVANAVLIQAAPDMLAALREALPQLGDAPAAAVVRAAIEKATTIPQNAGYGTRSGYADDPMDDSDES